MATQKYSGEVPATLLLGTGQDAPEKAAPDIILASLLLHPFLPVCRIKASWGKEHPGGRGKESPCLDSSFHGEKQARSAMGVSPQLGEGF